MPSFFFMKRTASSSSPNAVGEPQKVQDTATASSRKHRSHIYAPATVPSVAFPTRHSFGDFPDANAIFSTMSPTLVPLQPSRRRNRPDETRFGTSETQRTGRSTKEQDENWNIAALPYPYSGSPSGTFGRPTIREKTMAKLKNHQNQSPHYQYQPRSRASSHSDRNSSETPVYSQYSSSSSFVGPGASEYTTPSPSNTFGVRTPIRSLGSGRRIRVGEIFFSHLETPPPLPPLDHPAFLQSSQSEIPGGQSSGGENINTSHFEDAPRHSRSLPSIRRVAKNPSSTVNSTRPRRRGSKSSFVSKLEGQSSKVVESVKKGHTRSQSRSSLKSNLSRRSSAEYSAKQVSMLDSGSKSQESWEVQVSKEMLRLSLAQDVVGGGHVSARGANWAHGESGEARGLGPAFTFQDSSSPDQDQSHYRAAAAGGTAAQHPWIPPSTDSPTLIATSMSEGHDASSSKGILNSSSGKFKPKFNHTARREGRSKSTPDHTRTPSPSPPKLNTVAAGSSSGRASSSLLVPPVISFTTPTPQASPISPKRTHHKSTPTHPTAALLPPSPPSGIQKSYSSGSSKRKADEAEVDGSTPPREHRTTFAPEPRTHRASANSGSSHAPSSFHRSKRVRTSLPFDSQVAAKSTVPSLPGDSPNAKSTGSWSSKTSRGSKTSTNNHQRSSRPPSTRDGQGAGHPPRRSSSRRSLSQASIPISAFMSPHAPSVSRSSTFHMRDPRKPSRIQDTPWGLSFPDEAPDGGRRLAFNGWTDRGGSPLHAWLFFIGFIIFPLWWFAGFIIPIPRTRRLEGGDQEKGVVLDDPQVEHDYKSWRRRCRILAGISIVTYIPFIVLVAIYA